MIYDHRGYGDSEEEDDEEDLGFSVNDYYEVDTLRSFSNVRNHGGIPAEHYMAADTLDCSMCIIAPSRVISFVRCDCCRRYFCDLCWSKHSGGWKLPCKGMSEDNPFRKVMRVIESRRDDNVSSLKSLALLAIPKKQIGIALDYLALGRQ